MNDRCDWVRARLGGFLDGELPEGERDAVAEHCATCAACRALREALAVGDQAVRAAAGDGESSAAEEGEFARRWAAFRDRHDLAAAESARAREPQAGAPWSGAEVAAGELEPELRGRHRQARPAPPAPPSWARTRVGRALRVWLAPRPAWRWAGLTGGAAVAAVLTLVLLTRAPHHPGGPMVSLPPEPSDLREEPAVEAAAPTRPESQVAAAASPPTQATGAARSAPRPEKGSTGVSVASEPAIDAPVEVGGRRGPAPEPESSWGGIHGLYDAGSGRPAAAAEVASIASAEEGASMGEGVSARLERAAREAGLEAAGAFDPSRPPEMAAALAGLEQRLLEAGSRGGGSIAAKSGGRDGAANELRATARVAAPWELIGDGWFLLWERGSAAGDCGAHALAAYERALVQVSPDAQPALRPRLEARIARLREALEPGAIPAVAAPSPR